MPRGKDRWAGRGFGPGWGFSTAREHSKREGATEASPGKEGPFSLRRTAWINREALLERRQALVSHSSNSFVTQKLWGSPHRHPSSSGPSVPEEEVSPWGPTQTQTCSSATPREGACPPVPPRAQCRLRGHFPTLDPLLASVLLYSVWIRAPSGLSHTGSVTVISFPCHACRALSPPGLTWAGRGRASRGVRCAPSSRGPGLWGDVSAASQRRGDTAFKGAVGAVHWERVGGRRDSPPHVPRRVPCQSREGRCAVSSGSGRPSLVPDRRMHRRRRPAHPLGGHPCGRAPRHGLCRSPPRLWDPPASASLFLASQRAERTGADTSRAETRPFAVAVTGPHGAVGPANLALSARAHRTPRSPHGASEGTSPSVEG